MILILFRLFLYLVFWSLSSCTAHTLERTYLLIQTGQKQRRINVYICFVLGVVILYVVLWLLQSACVYVCMYVCIFAR